MKSSIFEIVSGSYAQPLTSTTPESSAVGSGRSTTPTKPPGSCARSAGPNAVSSKERTRPRVTHLHISPTSTQPECDLLLDDGSRPDDTPESDKNQIIASAAGSIRFVCRRLYSPG